MSKLSLPAGARCWSAPPRRRAPMLGRRASCRARAAGRRARGRSSSSPRRAAAPARRPMPISAAGRASRHRRAVVPRRLLGLYRLEGSASPRATTTERQRAYARALKQRYVYTPEMVVDGIAPRHRPSTAARSRRCWPTRSASRPSARRPSCRASSTARSRSSSRRSRSSGRRPTSRWPSTTAATRRRWRAARTRAACSRTSTSCAISRCVGRWDGSAATWTVPADRFQPDQGMAVLVQHADHGPMIGCNKLEPMVTG